MFAHCCHVIQLQKLLKSPWSFCLAHGASRL
jgi:hypothetical protein